jgi:4-hydroxybenzoate polyprenyltransferase
MRRANRLLLLKTIALLSMVRWWNILLLIAAQYLTSVFVLQSPSLWKHTLMDVFLHLLVLSTSLVVAAGFIINNFYDKEKDLVNRPHQTAFEHLVSQPTALNFYLFFNLAALVIAAGISFRAVLFFAAYALALWLYSHKVKRLPMVANLVKGLLSFVPFFAVFIYYKLPHWELVFYALFLFTLELSRGLVKDVIGLKGAVVFGYPTVPARTGDLGLQRHLLMVNLWSWLFGAGLILLNGPMHWGILLYLALMLLLQALTTWKLPTWVEVPEKANRLHSIYKLVLIGGVVLLPLLH